MKAECKKILKILNQRATFKIPVYQRNYDWNEKQCKEYIDSLEKIIVDKLDSYFMGSIVYIEGIDDNYFDEFVIVDGQQRITTTHLFLKALSKLSFNDDFSDKIKEEYLYNTKGDSIKLKLKPIKEDKEVFSRLIEEDKLLFTNYGSKIYQNFKFIEEELSQRNFPLELFFNALQKVQVIEISLDRKNDDPQSIFENINATGLSLTEADLIRNYLLMDKEYDKQTYFFEEYWYKIESLINSENISDFIRDFLTMETGNIPKKDMVYFDFKEYCKDKNLEIEKILKKLVFFAKIYKYFLNSDFPNSKEISNELYVINEIIKSISVYPFLLKIFSYYENDEIQTRDVLKILKLIVSYLMRRKICSSTSGANSTFAILSHKRFNIDNLYFEIEAELLSRKYPNNQVFKEQFKLFKTKKITEYILKNIEKINNNELSSITIDSLNIEYIAPKKLTSEWSIELSNLDGRNFKEIHESYVDTFGNLTLLDNSNDSSKVFKEKNKKYNTSNLFLNKYFNKNKLDNWSKKEVDSHAEWLYKEAQKIYFYNPHKNIGSRIIKNISLSDANNITMIGKKPQKVYIYDSEFSCSSWSTILKKFMEFVYNNYHDELLKLAEIDFKSYISTNSSKLRSSSNIGIVFFETNSNTDQKLNFMNLICDRLSINSSKITIDYK